MKDGFTGLIFVLVGPSASGKTTLLEAVTNGYYKTFQGDEKGLPEEYRPYSAKLRRIVTATTRPPRPGEIDGVHYKFKTREGFEDERAKGNLIGETVYAGRDYGILKSEIDKVLKQEFNGIMALDINGVKSLKERYGDKRVISIFIYRDIGDIFEELKKRPWAEEEFFARFEAVKEELKIMPKCDEVVFNFGQIEEVIRELLKVIKCEVDKMCL